MTSTIPTMTASGARACPAGSTLSPCLHLWTQDTRLSEPSKASDRGLSSKFFASFEMKTRGNPTDSFGVLSGGRASGD